MRIEVQGEAIQSKGLCINDVLLDMSIGYTTDHIVRNARCSRQLEVLESYRITYTGLVTAWRGVTRQAPRPARRLTVVVRTRSIVEEKI